MDNKITTVVAEEISVQGGRMTAYAITYLDKNNKTVDTSNVWDSDMPHIENDCKNNGWKLSYRHFGWDA